jgi:hypothetical protein
MLTVKPTENRPCFLCGKTDRTVEAKFKDGTFSGVVCWEELYGLMAKRNGKKETAERQEKKP